MTLATLGTDAIGTHQARRPDRTRVVHHGPLPVTIGPMVHVELERVEALELLGMVLAHLNNAESMRDLSPRVATLLSVRDKLAAGLREQS